MTNFEDFGLQDTLGYIAQLRKDMYPERITMHVNTDDLEEDRMYIKQTGWCLCKVDKGSFTDADLVLLSLRYGLEVDDAEDR